MNLLLPHRRGDRGLARPSTLANLAQHNVHPGQVVPQRSSEIGETTTVVHGTTVAVDAAALLIRGPAGSGKSSLALQMIALGASLVSDDRTLIEAPDDGPPVARPPQAIAGLIEARGIGVLHVAHRTRARLCAVVDLSESEMDRMPPLRVTHLVGRDVPLILRAEGPAFAAALVQLLRGARVAP
ncbi:HPr kinase/phosphorylase [Roseitranquillus sediminis]|uniref:HPr kinase/phosphorylase n=1 Tax=Roseitranquillus sediminis TaxID=2809051 RepID=UPI0029CA08BD|nr:serine kinase [Roseitranquillus sediminis]MBM9596300.1 serine kinase [Roseitranquillus sediminis]